MYLCGVTMVWTLPLIALPTINSSNVSLYYGAKTLQYRNLQDIPVMFGRIVQFSTITWKMQNKV